MAAPTAPDNLRWYSVRCVFKHGDAMFEERITVWRAENEDHAIQLAEDEAVGDNDELAGPCANTSQHHSATCTRST